MPFGSNSLWLAVSPHIPGSGAIRIPSRVVLVLLVPAAFGLAFLLERLDHGRWSVTAWCLALICLVEQTGTTETFDRDVSRRWIAKVTLARSTAAPGRSTAVPWAGRTSITMFI